MTTRIYGACDDLIEFEGDVRGEVECYGTDERDHGVLLTCSDGTVLDVQYGKSGRAIWGVRIIKAGELFERIDACDDEDADPYSDQANFRDGLRWVFASTEWERVK